MTLPLSSGRRLRHVLVAVLAGSLVAAATFVVPGAAGARSAQGDSGEAAGIGLLEPAAPPQAHGAPDDIVVNGSGWGHGVGMSQYGAYAMALQGKGHGEILRYFYQGSGIGILGQGGLSSPGPMWVNLVPGFSNATLRVVNAYDGSNGGPVKITRGNTSWNAPVGTRIHVKGPSNCSLFIERPAGNDTTTAKGGCSFDFDLQNPGSPTTAVAVEGCTHYDRECRYARGMLHVRSGLNGLDLSAKMSMEEYMLGIAEMPYSWGNGGMAALKAQAVAARSYARELQIVRGAPNPHANPSNSCAAWCHVRDTIWDQFYIGWGFEDANWRQAVASTSGQVVTHTAAPTSGIVRAYYSSSSGGKTENIHEVWSHNPTPYYLGVPDPWAANPGINPNATWSVRLGNSEVAGKVGLDAVADVRVIARNSSGSASTVAFTGPSGGQTKTVTFSSSWMRTTFGLLSVYFNVRLGAGGPTGRGGPFIDIAGSVHAGDIIAIYNRGITKGCNPPANTLYCPTGNVTRGQMAAFLVRALDLPATDVDYFDDDDGSVFQDDINRLAASGITAGCADRRFCPGAAITRGQMAAFLDRAFGYTAGTGSARFSDAYGTTFEENINRVAAAGVTVGCNPPANDRFCPTDPVSRAQMASFIERALGGSS